MVLYTKAKFLEYQKNGVDEDLLENAVRSRFTTHVQSRRALWPLEYNVFEDDKVLTIDGEIRRVTDWVKHALERATEGDEVCNGKS